MTLAKLREMGFHAVRRQTLRRRNAPNTNRQALPERSERLIATWNGGDALERAAKGMQLVADVITLPRHAPSGGSQPGAG